MGEIQTRGVLRIALPEEHPPLAILDEGEPKGFLVDLAELIAASLGVEAEYVSAPSEELLDMVHPDPDDPEATTEVDVAFPIVPITEELVTTRTMSDPYWVGHTRQLTDLEAGGSFERLFPAPESGPDLELLPVAYEIPGLFIDGPEDSTEGYGAAVRTGAVTFGALVSQVINEADAEGDWSAFYERWLAKYFADPAPDDVPIMTVEEAAALYPAGLD
jgi:ABC-type amino acid transport substrate-binding protein